MKFRKILPAVVFVAAAVALAAPMIFAGQKPGPSRTRYTDAWTGGDLTGPPGSTGWGKGSLTLPAGQQPGMLVGVVKQGDAMVRYCIEAELTGCIPLLGEPARARYWFGCVYGRLQQIVDSPPSPGQDDVLWCRVEGTWVLDKYDEGTISAQLFGRNEAGIEYVCGILFARFEVSEAMPGPMETPLGCSTRLSDRRPILKASLLPHPDGLGAPKVTADPGGPLGYLRPFKDADELMWRKFGGTYERLPGSADWRDARPTLPPFAIPPLRWPVFTGTFGLRYQLYE